MRHVVVRPPHPTVEGLLETGRGAWLPGCSRREVPSNVMYRYPRIVNQFGFAASQRPNGDAQASSLKLGQGGGREEEGLTPCVRALHGSSPNGLGGWAAPFWLCMHARTHASTQARTHAACLHSAGERWTGRNASTPPRTPLLCPCSSPRSLAASMGPRRRSWRPPSGRGGLVRVRAHTRAREWYVHTTQEVVLPVPACAHMGSQARNNTTGCSHAP